MKIIKAYILSFVMVVNMFSIGAVENNMQFTQELLNAIRCDDIDEAVRLVEYAVERGIDINAEGYHYKIRPLAEAAWMGKANVVKLLLNHGAYINIGWENGYTPLHLAVLNGHVNTVRLLLNRGASLYSSNLANKKLEDITRSQAIKTLIMHAREDRQMFIDLFEASFRS